jgi:protein-disulfide isomerase
MAVNLVFSLVPLTMLNAAAPVSNAVGALRRCIFPADFLNARGYGMLHSQDTLSGSKPLILFRRAFLAAAFATVLLAISGATPISSAFAEDVSAADLAAPSASGDMTQGPKDAPVTIIEYASMSCPHCAHWFETVYPRVKSGYIDTGKVRYIFREFPHNFQGAAGSMLARCIGKDDPQKYFGAVDVLFRTQDSWLSDPVNGLKRIGKQAGLTDQAVEACLSDQAALDALQNNVEFASRKLGIDSIPTFFINGTRLKGGAEFEEFEKAINPKPKG